MLKAGTKTVYGHEAKLKCDMKGVLGQTATVQLIQCMLKEPVHRNLLLVLVHPRINQLAPIAGIGCPGDIGSDPLERMDYRGLLEDWQSPASAETEYQVQDREEFQNACKPLDAFFRPFGYNRDLALLKGKEGDDFVIVTVLCGAKHDGGGRQMRHKCYNWSNTVAIWK